jgi:hypothetical protein
LPKATRELLFTEINPVINHREQIEPLLGRSFTMRRARSKETAASSVPRILKVYLSILVGDYRNGPAISRNTE